MEVSLKRVKLQNGEEYGYREAGNGEELVLLIHGNLVSSRHWGKLIDSLGERYRVVALDLRGAGISTYNNPVLSFKDWADEVKLFCDELKLKDFTLVGWSMGGGISQRFVVDYPGYARKLVLYESVPPTGNPIHKKGTNGEILPECHETMEDVVNDRIQIKPSLDALEQKNKAYIKYLWDILVFNVKKPDDEEYDKLLDDILMTRNLKGAAWGAHTFNISHAFNGVVPGTSEIDRIDIPVLVTCGDKDLIIPPVLNEFTAKEIGENALLKVFPGCSHIPHYDNLELVLDALTEFIDK